MDFTITAHADLSLIEIAKLLKERSNDTFLLDVRTPEEVAAGYLPGALNIPIQELEQRLNELPAPTANKHILCYCRSGTRSHNAALLLRGLGYRATNIGGYEDLLIIG